MKVYLTVHLQNPIYREAMIGYEGFKASTEIELRAGLSPQLGWEIEHPDLPWAAKVIGVHYEVTTTTMELNVGPAPMTAPIEDEIARFKELGWVVHGIKRPRRPRARKSRKGAAK